MFCKLLSIGLASLIFSFANVAVGQHHDDHGGHYDWHNGHIDYHQPSHWDVHNGHLDYHPGHVDHIQPTYYPSYPITPYYPSTPIYGSTIYPSSPIYSSGTVISSSQPVISSAAPANALPNNRTTTGYTPNGAPINVINPENYGTALSFKLNGQTVRLEPGKQSSMSFDRNYTIEFDRGGDFGTAKYTLRDGDFQFTVGDQGWDLKKIQASANAIPQINNSATPQNPLPGGG